MRELESRVGVQEAQLLRYKQDVAALRETESTLRTQLSEASASASAAASTSASEDVAYLQTRITDLETELSAKAEEVEEADTKILMALKEQKKYSSRVKHLTAKVDELTKQLQANAHPTSGTGTGTGAGVKEIAPLPNRKRSSPEKEGETVEPAVGGVEARAVYAPAGGFTPVRRGVTGVHRTPTSSSGSTLGGMKRSTSNPSELISARLSPAKAAEPQPQPHPQPSEPFKPTLSPVQTRKLL